MLFGVSVRNLLADRTCYDLSIEEGQAGHPGMQCIAPNTNFDAKYRTRNT